MKAIATVIRGTASEKKFDLDPSQPIRIGRGSGCQICLSDPLSSRTHVIISYEDSHWVASDADSRNGTLVNDKKITQVRLRTGDRIQIGSTELLFEHLDDQEDTEPSGQTLLLEAPISREASGVSAMSQLINRQRSQDMVDMYQLSICLIRCSTPDEVAKTGVEMLRVRTGSTAVGFLWMNDRGQLKPQMVVPSSMTEKFRLQRKLAERVCREGRAIWIKDQSLDKSQNAPADAICVPLLSDNSVLGAVHLYRDEGPFEQSHFDFAISVGIMLAVALERSRAQASLSAENERLIQRSGDFSELIGESPPMNRLKDRIARVAKANGCALVRGESGVGKELVSRAIHRLSPRKDRPLLCVNCAAIPSELIESQLFGHKRGSFTGADKDHSGFFQQAHTGTLFLDEVGELNLEGQAKLLRILEGHPFLPVGDTKEVHVDVRVIAATNRDLREYVRDKKFREDLYYRLSVFELNVPPLRERGKDIDELIEYFFAHFKKQHGRQALKLTDEARKMLREYQWPGNVRQLRNVIDSAVVLAADTSIQPGDLSLRDVGVDRLETLRLDVWEERLIRESLNRTNNNIVEATKMLGVSRATLYRKLEQYSIARN